MRALFLQALSVALAGSVTALFMLLVTALLCKLHAPARLQCVLWGLVAIRFVLPGGIPVAVARPQSAPLSHAAALLQPIAAPQAGAATAMAAQEGAPVVSTVPWYAQLTVFHLLAVVWGLGAAVLIVRAVYACLKLKRRVALACKTADGCYTGPAVDAPFTLGLFAPRIYMPTSLRGSARQSVLLHERTHIARRDTLTKPLVYLVACLHWWNPLAWLTFTYFERTMEAACDEAATRTADTAHRAAYCENILRFAQTATTPGSLAFGQGRVKDRILHILHYRRPGRAALALCAAVALLAGTACMAKPTVAPQAPVQSGVAEGAATAEPAPSATAAPAAEPAESAVPTESEQAAEPTTAAEKDSGTATNAAIETTGNALFDPHSLISPLSGSYYISRLCGSGHKGDDLAADKGTAVSAVAAGVVLTAEWHESYGKYVIIDHGKDAEGHVWQTLYSHLDGITVSAGQTVAQGEQLGTMGNTGASTGVHLHIELHCDGAIVPPSDYLPYPDPSAAVAQTAAAF